MLKRCLSAAALAAAFLAVPATAQDYPVVDKIAQKIIAKYQNATCEQLWQERSATKPAPTGREAEALQILRNDPNMQQALFSQIAAPVVTKMFQCGMIP